MVKTMTIGELMSLLAQMPTYARVVRFGSDDWLVDVTTVKESGETVAALIFREQG